MRFIPVLILLAASVLITASPVNNVNAQVVRNNHDINAETIHTDTGTDTDKQGAPRFSCGQYKFNDGTVQEFYSQVWAGLPADRMICRPFKYEFHDKKGQEGTMVAAKVDSGCTCFFYEAPCDPGKGHAEQWVGWMGWQNYAFTDRKFKGWYCFEQA